MITTIIKTMELNIIYNEDCFEYFKRIQDKSIDMILCDLPYGITDCDWDNIIDLETLWKEYNRIIKNNGAIVLTACQPFTSKLIMSNIKNYKTSWVWNKKQAGNFANAKYHPLKITEDILIFSKGKTKYNPQMTKGKERYKGGYKINGEIYKGIKKSVDKYLSDEYYPTNIIEIYNPKNKRLHPTQKPVELFKYLIKTYSNEGDIILDNCMGSGTTAVAAKELNRNFTGCELNKDYFDICLKRLNDTP